MHRLAPLFDGRFLTVSARAPIGLGPGKKYAWAHTRFTPEGPVDDARGLEESRLALLRFLDEPVADHRPGQVYVMGFSQGATLSLSLALTRPDRLAGVVAMSGLVLPEFLPRMGLPDTPKDLPVFLTHGTEDPLVPVDRARAGRDLLASLSDGITYREYRMGHEPGTESLRDATEWLKEQLDRESKPGAAS